MREAPALPTVIALRSFDRAAKGLVSEANLDALAVRLAENPTEGAVIEATAGVRKLHVGLEGRGRRGGARVIYYYRSAKGRVYLLYAYAKNEADNHLRGWQEADRRAGRDSQPGAVTRGGSSEHANTLERP